jgi:uncharacterized protein YndB with AHSA1/START domain
MTTMAKQETKQLKVQVVGDREIHFERALDAPVERVWRAYTEPQLLAQWWGRGNELKVVRFEFERGGHWRLEEHAHGEVHGFEGRYGDIEPMKRIRQTFEWDGMPTHVALDTIEFIDQGDGTTLMRGMSLFMTAADRDGMVSSGMEGGMKESYAALDRVLAAGF